MSPHDPHDEEEGRASEERELQALFDATAEPPSPEQLHRLARTAAQIPERSKAPSPVLVWLRRLVPAIGLAAAAAAWFFFLRDAGVDDGGAPSPTVAVTSPATSAGEPGEPDRPDSAGDPLLDDGQEELALAVLDGEAETDPEEDLGGELDNPLASIDLGTAAVAGPLDGLEVLFPPEDDEESLDLYSEALDELLEEDG